MCCILYMCVKNVPLCAAVSNMRHQKRCNKNNNSFYTIYMSEGSTTMSHVECVCLRRASATVSFKLTRFIIHASIDCIICTSCKSQSSICASLFSLSPLRDSHFFILFYFSILFCISSCLRLKFFYGKNGSIKLFVFQIMYV